MTKELLVVVLEGTLVNTGFGRIVGIVVVLGPELNLVKILGAFTGKDLLVKAEPSTVGSLDTGPQEVTSTVTLVFYFSFKDFIDVTLFNNVSVFVVDFFLPIPLLHNIFGL